MIPHSILSPCWYPYAPATASLVNTSLPKHPANAVSLYPYVCLITPNQPLDTFIPSHNNTNPNYSSLPTDFDFDPEQLHPPHIFRVPSKLARTHMSIRGVSLSNPNSCWCRMPPSVVLTVDDTELADMPLLMIWARMLVDVRRGRRRFVGSCSLSGSR